MKFRKYLTETHFSLLLGRTFIVNFPPSALYLPFQDEKFMTQNTAEYIYVTIMQACLKSDKEHSENLYSKKDNACNPHTLNFYLYINSTILSLDLWNSAGRLVLFYSYLILMNTFDRIFEIRHVVELWTRLVFSGSLYCDSENENLESPCVARYVIKEHIAAFVAFCYFCVYLLMLGSHHRHARISFF